MARIALWSIFAVMLLVISPLAPVAKGWSTPVYTEPWTEVDPIETEPESEESLGDDFTLNFEQLYGTWYIWTPGAAVGVYNSDGEYIKHNYVQGAAQGMIVIKEDGNYSMSHSAWDKDNVVEGKWRFSYPREINGEVLQAIVLLDGITDTDWAVAPSPNGKIRLLWAMKWADGSATWVFDAELDRD